MMPNRLADSLSPYLLQHKDNPIDWYPWGTEAWERASREGRPVFLSIGYSSCHWCHVMAHESFEDSSVAEALNRSFVSIKVDREERPDIDETYMTAVQLSNGHGGWPMSLFLTPEMKPFFAGTYFPKEGRGEFPGFLTLVQSLAKAWNEQRAEVLQASEEFTTAVQASLERTLPTDIKSIDLSLLDQVLEVLHQDFDFDHGGFGTRPKFPPHGALAFLIDYASMRSDLGHDPSGLAGQAAHMALQTLEKIVLGGIHDHVGGGFHRYSTDEQWLLPHFEKMQSDNAQLLSALCRASTAATDQRLRSLFSRAADKCAAWIQGDMTSDSGLFYSSVDADSDGGEGKYYVWTWSEVELTVHNSEFLSAFQLSKDGNFRDEATGIETGENILHLLVDNGKDWSSELATLAQIRSLRVKPATDTKAIAFWNALTISALVEYGDLDSAIKCATFWKQFGENLPHFIVSGIPIGTAFLDDVAGMVDAYLDIFDATKDDIWYAAAEQLSTRLTTFQDLGTGYTYTSSDHDILLGRTKPYMDSATPSPMTIVARVLRRMGRLDESIAVVRSGLGWVQRAPRASESALREILHLIREHDDMVTESIRTAQSEVSMRLENLLEGDDGWWYCQLLIDIPPGMHINSHDPIANWLVPTALVADGAYAEVAFPDAKDGVFSGETRLDLRLRKNGADPEFQLTVTYQLCSETECFRPESTVILGRLSEHSGVE